MPAWVLNVSSLRAPQFVVGGLRLVDVCFGSHGPAPCLRPGRPGRAAERKHTAGTAGVADEASSPARGSAAARDPTGSPASAPAQSTSHVYATLCAGAGAASLSDDDARVGAELPGLATTAKAAMDGSRAWERDQDISCSCQAVSRHDSYEAGLSGRSGPCRTGARRLASQFP